MIVFLKICLPITCFAADNSISLEEKLTNDYLLTVGKNLGTAWDAENIFTDSGLRTDVNIKILPNGNMEDIFFVKKSKNTEFNEKVYKTINSSGTHEQWVYGGGNYLYFDDGVLSSIQK